MRRGPSSGVSSDVYGRPAVDCSHAYVRRSEDDHPVEEIDAADAGRDRTLASKMRGTREQIVEEMGQLGHQPLEAWRPVPARVLGLSRRRQAVAHQQALPIPARRSSVHQDKRQALLNSRPGLTTASTGAAGP